MCSEPVTLETTTPKDRKESGKGVPLATYTESLQPMVRGSSVSVIEMAANEPKELAESLRPAGVSIEAPVHLAKKIVENGRVRSEAEVRSATMAFMTTLGGGVVPNHVSILPLPQLPWLP